MTYCGFRRHSGSIPVTVLAYYRLRRAAGAARTGGAAAPALVSPDATAGTVAESSAQADELRR